MSFTKIAFGALLTLPLVLQPAFARGEGSGGEK